MRASIATLTTVLAALLACGGTADITDGVVVTPPPAEAPAPAPAGSTLAGSGTANSPHQADCNTTALALGKNASQTDHVKCPAGCTTGSLWGTGVYTGDSRVCVAAVHAGAIPGGAGGTVIVTLVGASSSFTGSVANGVTSSSWSPESLLNFSVAATTGTPVPRDPERDGRGGKTGGGGGDRAGKVKGGKNR